MIIKDKQFRYLVISLVVILAVSLLVSCSSKQPDETKSKLAPDSAQLASSNQLSSSLPKQGQDTEETNAAMPSLPLKSESAQAVLVETPTVESQNPDILIESQPDQNSAEPLSAGPEMGSNPSESALPEQAIQNIEIDLSIPQEPQVGGRAPEFTLQDVNGETVQLSSLLGRPLVINYWATWCVPCKQELPILDKLHKEYSERGVVFVSINALDQDSLTSVQQLITELNMTLPVLLDQDRQFADGYQAIFFPTTYLIDAGGVIREISLGDNTEAELRASLENLLAGS